MNSPRKACGISEIYGLVFILLITKLFTNQSLVFSGISGTGAPLSALCSGIGALFIIYISTHKFYCSSDKGNIINKAEKHLGIPGKYAVSLLLLGYLLLSSAFTIHQFPQLSKLVSFPTAPLWFISIFFVIAALSGAFAKEDVLLRISKFIAPFLFTILLVLLISVLCQSDFLNLFPILGTGTSNTLGKGLSGITLYSDIILIFLINPFSQSGKTTRNAILISSLISVTIVFLAVLTFTAKIPYPLSLDGDFPLYFLLKEVYYGRFFQRIDALFLLASSLCGMLYLSVNFYLFSKVMAQSFDVVPPTATIFPFALIIFLFGTGCLPISQNAVATILFFLSLVTLGVIFIISLLSRKEVNPSYEK